MRLIDKQVRVNPETYTSELLVTVSIPWELMNTDAKQGEDAMAYKIIGEKFIDILKSLTKQSAADRIFMNERIKQLYEQAHGRKPTMVIDHETGQAVHATFRGEPMYTKDFDPKKFAELIVRECAGVSENHKGMNDKYFIADAIKKHFEVEE